MRSTFGSGAEARHERGILRGGEGLERSREVCLRVGRKVGGRHNGEWLGEWPEGGRRMDERYKISFATLQVTVQ